MRLRKHASKLLGWVYSSQFHSSSFPETQPCWPPPAEAAGADAGELHCQLNQSPWDAIESPHCTNSQEEFGKSNGEEELEMDGVVKSGYKAKEDDEEEEDDERLEEIVKENNDEKRPSRDSRDATEAEMETAAAAGMKCKKTDGKGWHCKRDSQIPHALCSYHLMQVRSYRTRFEEQIYGNGSRGNSKRRPKSSAAGESGGVASNYYYYSVIGPWWSKRRGPINVTESSESDRSPQEHDDTPLTDNIDNGGVADEEEEVDDGSRCDPKPYKKKRQLKKKRGRKPVKARSLKSLL